MANTIVNPLYPRPYIHVGQSSNASGVLLAVTSTTVATSFSLQQFKNPAVSTESTPPCELIFMDVQNASVVVGWGGTPLLNSYGNVLAAGTNYTWQFGSTLLTASFVLASGSTTAYLFASQFSV